MHGFGSTYTVSAYPRDIIVYKLFPFLRLHMNAGIVVPSPGIRMSASPYLIAFNHRLCRIVMFSTLTIDLLCFRSTCQLYIKCILQCEFEANTQYSIQVHIPVVAAYVLGSFGCGEVGTSAFLDMSGGGPKKHGALFTSSIVTFLELFVDLSSASSSSSEVSAISS